MNVSQQLQGRPQQSSIQREVRQRKELTQKEQLQSIKPFRGCRRGGQASQSSKIHDHNEVGGSKVQVQPVKLRRQYPLHGVDSIKGDGQSRQSKFRYDLSGKGDENRLTVNYLSESIQKKDRVKDQKMQGRESRIKKNQGYVPTPLGLTNNPRKKQVESIIFDSKVAKKSQIGNLDIRFVRSFDVSQEILADKSLQSFQEKVNKVNDEIEAGLFHLQKMIADLKQKKIAESQIQSQVRAAERLQRLQKQFADRRAQTRQKKDEQEMGKEQDSKSLEQQIKVQQKVAIDKNLVVKLIEKEKELQNRIQNVNFPVGGRDDQVSDSHIQLQGNFKNKSNQFPPEYTTFINRLANQIDKDIQFTNKVNDLIKANQIKSIKELIMSEMQKHESSDVKIDESFFVIESSEMDPLDYGKPSWYKQYSEQEIEQQALKVFKLYRDSDSHFKNKLQNKCSTSVIDLLLEQLSRFNFTKASVSDSDSVTVGHLLSYLNMRTNKSFRNRTFVKMLKRLSLKPNSILNASTLAKLIVDV